MRVKLVLPALTEAKSPFFRPIKYSLFPPLSSVSRERPSRNAGHRYWPAVTQRTTRPAGTGISQADVPGHRESSNAVVSEFSTGSRDIWVNVLHARHGEFEKVPIGGATYKMDTNQSIANDTITDVAFTEASEAGSYFRIDETGMAKIYLRADLPIRKLAVIASVQFASHATGRRGAHIESV